MYLLVLILQEREGAKLTALKIAGACIHMVLLHLQLVSEEGTFYLQQGTLRPGHGTLRSVSPLLTFLLLYTDPKRLWIKLLLVCFQRSLVLVRANFLGFADLSCYCAFMSFPWDSSLVSQYPFQQFA